MTHAPLQFLPVVAGQQSGVVDESQRTIRTEADWIALRDAIGAPSPHVPIDFDRQMVLVVFGGVHQSQFGHQWWTNVLEAPIDHGALVTATWYEVRRNQPTSPRFGGPQEETPYLVVVADAHPGPIVWTKERQRLP